MGVLKSAGGLTISDTYIYERVLDIIPRLCWKPEDIGLTRKYIIRGIEFPSKTSAKKYATEKKIPENEIKYYFSWVNEVASLQGIERETYLREQYWPRREQVVNSMLDSIFQMYIKELPQIFSKISSTTIGSLRYCNVKTTNKIRRITGQPDIFLLDTKNKNILLIEIKIGGKTTKYNLDQLIKYITLSALLKSPSFFPEYNVINFLLAPMPKFLENTKGLESLNPKPVGQHDIFFDFNSPKLHSLIKGYAGRIDSLIEKRLSSLRSEIDLDHKYSEEFYLKFSCWSKFYELIECEGLKENIKPILPYLLGEQIR